MERIDVNTSARDLVLVLFKWKWTIAGIVVVGVLSTVVWLWGVRDDVYETNAKVLVKLGREQAPPTTALNDRPMNIVGQRAQQDVNSEADILQSADLLNQVIEELHLDAPYQPPPYPESAFKRVRWHVKETIHTVKDQIDEILIAAGMRPRLTQREKTLAALKDGLHVIPQKDSNVLLAQLFVRSREGSNKILNTLLDRYLEQRLRYWQGDDALKFFRAQSAAAATELHQAEDRLQAFEQRWTINAIDRQQDVLLTSLADARARREAASLEYQTAQAKVQRLEAELERPEPDLAVLGEYGRGSFPESAISELARLRNEREKLRMTEQETSPGIQALTSQIKLLIGQATQNVRATLADSRATFEARSREYEALETRLNELHDKSMEWRDQRRNAKVLEDRFLLYRHKLDEASGIDELDRRRIGNVVVIERATDPLKPAGMRKLTLLSIALVAVLFGALTAAVLAEYFDHGIYAAADLAKHVSAPVIGVIAAGKAGRTREVLRRPVTTMEWL